MDNIETKSKASCVTFEDCFEIDEQTLIHLTYKPQSLRLLELGHQFLHN